MRVLVVSNDASLAVALSLMADDREVVSIRSAGEIPPEGAASFSGTVIDVGTTYRGLEVARELADAGVAAPFFLLGDVEAPVPHSDVDLLVRPFTLEQLHQRLSALIRRPEEPSALTCQGRSAGRFGGALLGRFKRSGEAGRGPARARGSNADTVKQPQEAMRREEKARRDSLDPVSSSVGKQPEEVAGPLADDRSSYDDFLAVTPATDKPAEQAGNDVLEAQPATSPSAPGMTGFLGEPEFDQTHEGESVASEAETPRPVPGEGLTAPPAPEPVVPAWPAPEPVTPTASATGGRLYAPPEIHAEAALSLHHPKPQIHARFRGLAVATSERPDTPSTSTLRWALALAQELEAMMDERPELLDRRAVANGVVEEIDRELRPDAAMVWVPREDKTYEAYATRGLDVAVGIRVPEEQSLFLSFKADIDAVLIAPLDVSQRPVSGIPGLLGESLVASALRLGRTLLGIVVVTGTGFTTTDRDRLAFLASRAVPDFAVAGLIERLRARGFGPNAATLHPSV